jgi:hypothetical protein
MLPDEVRDDDDLGYLRTTLWHRPCAFWHPRDALWHWPDAIWH